MSSYRLKGLHHAAVMLYGRYGSEGFIRRHAIDALDGPTM